MDASIDKDSIQDILKIIDEHSKNKNFNSQMPFMNSLPGPPPPPMYYQNEYGYNQNYDFPIPAHHPFQHLQAPQYPRPINYVSNIFVNINFLRWAYLILQDILQVKSTKM
jgi:hypothetical protein